MNQEYIKYTWYVNSVGDIQIYKGFVDERRMWDYMSEKDVRNHKIVWYDKTEKDYERCKYWISSKYAETFFTFLNLTPFQFNGTIGYTDIELADWLD